MKFATLAGTIIATFIASAIASPLTDVASTTVELDKNRASLDAGEVTFHITRTDDLISDGADHSVLLERISHIVLKIQLDGDGLMVNGDHVSLVEDDGMTNVHIIKAEALLLPDSLPSTMVSASELAALTNQLSPGIVSLEVRIDSQVESPHISQVSEDGEVRSYSVDGVRIRRVGVFVKINEIEGIDIAHSSLLYAPILQLLVTSETQGGTKVQKITTISIADETPILDLSPNPFIPQSLPPKEVVGVKQPFHPPLPTTFVSWLANLFGLAPRRPCTRTRASHAPVERETAVVEVEAVGGTDSEDSAPEVESHGGPRRLLTHPQISGNPFDDQRADSEDRPHHSHPHHHHGNGTHHGHHRHGRKPLCFLRRFIMGLAFVTYAIWNTLIVKVILGVALGWVLGIAFHRRRQTALVQSIIDSEVDYSNYGDEKKSILCDTDSEELPVYDEISTTPVQHEIVGVTVEPREESNF